MALGVDLGRCAPMSRRHWRKVKRALRNQGTASERSKLMRLYSVAMLKIAASRRMFGMTPLQQAHFIASN